MILEMEEEEHMVVLTVVVGAEVVVGVLVDNGSSRNADGAVLMVLALGGQVAGPVEVVTHCEFYLYYRIHRYRYSHKNVPTAKRWQVEW